MDALGGGCGEYRCVSHAFCALNTSFTMHHVLHSNKVRVEVDSLYHIPRRPPTPLFYPVGHDYPLNDDESSLPTISASCSSLPLDSSTCGLRYQRSRPHAQPQTSRVLGPAVSKYAPSPLSPDRPSIPHARPHSHSTPIEKVVDPSRSPAFPGHWTCRSQMKWTLTYRPQSQTKWPIQICLRLMNASRYVRS